ncbi:MAG: prolipoprotein diacylglyceryl transferase [Paludibacter sp.]|jgi:prolipoprotein diacylglyceryl transferase|nr:prolipoprotein diacylglyceryl transferase [Paludibacter sp.]
MNLFITWNVNPEIFPNILPIRWYGLMWALGIWFCYLIVARMFKFEKLPDKWMDNLFFYTVAGTIIGARLGHCLFYGAPNDFFFYYTHPLEIIKVWEGGLASHGGALGIIAALWLYNKNVSHKGFIWTFDRLVVGAAITGACIRFGNLLNSEIYGGVTSMPWGFNFVKDTMWHLPVSMGGAGEQPCHPTQIYEMLYCLVAFGVTYWLYWYRQAYKRTGLIFGVFLLIIFGTRFLLEFIKFNQENFEQNMFLNMGQILSIPFIIWGIWLIWRTAKKPEKMVNS